jgi:hypothetical protein
MTRRPHPLVLLAAITLLILVVGFLLAEWWFA